MSSQKQVIAVFTHPVKDYAAWRKVFDAAAPLHDRMGIISTEVFQDPKDPNMVIVVDRYPDMATMERFVHSPELAAALGDAGVIGQPTLLVGLST